jgi:predicted GNAT family acetyltransferase
VIRLDILDRSGRSVAEGRLIVRGELAVFDRILVVEDHRRRGLGSAVMQALGAEALRSGAGQGLLVATPAGHALYRRLGWCLLSHYTSASRTA